MLFTPIFYIFYLFLLGLLAILPSSAGLPSGFNTALSGIFNGAYAYNSIFPIDTVVTILQFLVIFEGGILLFKIVNWIIGKVRGSN